MTGATPEGFLLRGEAFGGSTPGLTLGCYVCECGSAEKHGVEIARHDSVGALFSPAALAQFDQSVRPHFDNDVVAVAVRDLLIMNAHDSVGFAVDQPLAVAIKRWVSVVRAFVIGWLVPLFDFAQLVFFHAINLRFARNYRVQLLWFLFRYEAGFELLEEIAR